MYLLVLFRYLFADRLVCHLNKRGLGAYLDKIKNNDMNMYCLTQQVKSKNVCFVSILPIQAIVGLVYSIFYRINVTMK